MPPSLAGSTHGSMAWPTCKGQGPARQTAVTPANQVVLLPISFPAVLAPHDPAAALTWQSKFLTCKTHDTLPAQCTDLFDPHIVLCPLIATDSKSQINGFLLGA